MHIAWELGNNMEAVPSKKRPAPTTTRRETWSRQIEFTISCIGYTVGLSNIWRFPYLCLRNGGGAFLIPYFTFLLLCGMPLYFMELCLGQFSGLSPLSMWKICPLFKGIGWGMLVVSGIISTYYNTIITWVLYYLGMSFRRDVPWKTCHNDWNTAECLVIGERNVTSGHENLNRSSAENSTGIRSPAEEFWSNRVLDLSSGIEDMGSVKWDLFICLLVAWLLIFLCLCKGIKSSGKVVYVTATMPYILLTVLLVRGATLPGSLDGVKYYIIPDFSRLSDFSVWTEACLQVFYSLGPAWGGLITMSSYNRFHNDCLKDAVIVSVACGISSLFGGFAIFTTIGFMAHETGVSVENVISQGPGLAFVAYPEAISRLPISPLWAVCFFIMLLSVGVDCQFATVETVCSGLVDEYPRYLKDRKTLFVAVVCAVMCLIGIPFVTKGGMYLFQIVDWYAGAFSVVVIAFAECVVVAYVYGIGRFYDDITLMLKRRPSRIWAVSWCGLTPCLLLIMLVVNAVQMVPPTYGEYTYPRWAIGLGWVFAMTSIVPLPCVAIYRVVTAQGSWKMALKTNLRPDDTWYPREEEYKTMYLARHPKGMPWKERMDMSTESQQTHELSSELIGLNCQEKGV